MPAPVALRVEHVSKWFPGVRAVDDVTVEVRRGEICGLAGHNGSGKSTLIKVLAGYYRPEPGGIIRVNGDEHRLDAISAPWRARLHFVHQNLALVSTANAIENLALGNGFPTGRLGRIRWRVARDMASALFKEFGVELDLRAAVRDLSAVEQTIVAIARALIGWKDDNQVLILDEPTACLPLPEAGKLFHAMQRVANRGAAILFVSQRPGEVLKVSDRVVVLRNGHVIAEQPSAELSLDSLVELIAGEPISPLQLQHEPAAGQVMLSVDGLHGDHLDGVSFSLMQGEVLGITGLEGSGREELAELLFGSKGARPGVIKIRGNPIGRVTPRRAVAHGLALVPADRLTQGSIQTMRVRENLTLPRLRPAWRRGHISRRRERAVAADWIQRFRVQPADPERTFRLLSAGNQQKIILAKWLRLNLDVLIEDEPTAALDAGAKNAIYELIAQTAAAGRSAIVVSPDADELAEICNRVLVLRRGRIAAELRGHRLTPESVIAECIRTPAADVI